MELKEPTPEMAEKPARLTVSVNELSMICERLEHQAWRIEEHVTRLFEAPGPQPGPSTVEERPECGVLDELDQMITRISDVADRITNAAHKVCDI